MQTAFIPESAIRPFEIVSAPYIDHAYAPSLDVRGVLVADDEAVTYAALKLG